MDELKLELYWQDIPIGKENAVTYPTLTAMWGMGERSVRMVLHELSALDNGDDYILVRSGQGKGFYKTDDIETIKAFRQECLNKGRSVFAPIKKINRVLTADKTQYTIQNNLRVYREERGCRQKDVSDYMRQFDTAVDVALISKFENGVCLPTPFQLALMANLYNCNESDLINVDFY